MSLFEAIVVVALLSLIRRAAIAPTFLIVVFAFVAMLIIACLVAHSKLICVSIW